MKAMRRKLRCINLIDTQESPASAGLFSLASGAIVVGINGNILPLIRLPIDTVLKVSALDPPSQ
jgi:hypothetical protein